MSFQTLVNAAEHKRRHPHSSTSGSPPPSEDPPSSAHTHAHSGGYPTSNSSSGSSGSKMLMANSSPSEEGSSGADKQQQTSHSGSSTLTSSGHGASANTAEGQHHHQTPAPPLHHAPHTVDVPDAIKRMMEADRKQSVERRVDAGDATTTLHHHPRQQATQQTSPLAITPKAPPASSSGQSVSFQHTTASSMGTSSEFAAPGKRLFEHEGQSKPHHRRHTETDDAHSVCEYTCVALAFMSTSSSQDTGSLEISELPPPSQMESAGTTPQERAMLRKMRNNEAAKIFRNRKRTEEAQLDARLTVMRQGVCCVHVLCVACILSPLPSPCECALLSQQTLRQPGRSTSCCNRQRACKRRRLPGCAASWCECRPRRPRRLCCQPKCRPRSKCSSGCSSRCSSSTCNTCRACKTCSRPCFSAACNSHSSRHRYRRCLHPCNQPQCLSPVNELNSHWLLCLCCALRLIYEHRTEIRACVL